MNKRNKPILLKVVLSSLIKYSKSSRCFLRLTLFLVVFLCTLFSSINTYAFNYCAAQSYGKSLGIKENYTTYLFRRSDASLHFINGALKEVIKHIKTNIKGAITRIKNETSIVESEYNHYYGLLHSHTGYSDGCGTPDRAFSFARDISKLDFFAVTDHSNLFDNDLNWVNSEEWRKSKETADVYNADGKFVTIIGYEMSWYNGNGHINTFNTDWFVSRNKRDIDLKTYYSMISKDQDSISQWNHPNSYFGFFNNFGYYSKETDRVINLIEVANGNGPIKGKNYMQCYDFYHKALDRGWHVAPTMNQDNHGDNWGTGNDIRTVVIAPRLTREEIFKSIRERRVYATEDKNLKLMYRVNGSIMGTVLYNPEDFNVEISVTDSDKSDIVKRIDIVSIGGSVVKSKSFDSNNVSWIFKLSAVNKYYYVKVIQADGDFAFSAPIWTGK